VKTTGFWIIILCGLLVLSVIAFILLKRDTADVALVYSDGVLIEQIDMTAISEPYTFTIETTHGTNTIAVERGRIRVVDADCPDKSCVKQGWVGSGVVPIVCLPHGLVIEFSGGGAPEIDAIAR